MNLPTSKPDSKTQEPVASHGPIELERRLGLFDATMIIVGNIIGIGIFTTTGLVADVLPNSKMILFAWILGGLLTLCGALTYAELGAMLPQAGGEYVYLREAYGPFWAFLSGWTYFFVTNPGSIAAMSLGGCAYLRPFWPSFFDHVLIGFQVPGFHWSLTTNQACCREYCAFFFGNQLCWSEAGQSGSKHPDDREIVLHLRNLWIGTDHRKRKLGQL